MNWHKIKMDPTTCCWMPNGGRDRTITIESGDGHVESYGTINALPEEFKGDDSGSGSDTEPICKENIETANGISKLYPPLLGKRERRARARSIREENRRRDRYQYLGLLLTLLSSVFSSLSALTVKLLEDDFHQLFICLWRFTIVLMTAVGAALFAKCYKGETLWPRRLVEAKYDHLKNIILLVVRGLMGCTARVLYVYSITFMNLGDAVVISSSSPVFMTLFAYVLIGEKCGVVPVLISFATLAGVGVIARPPILTGGEPFDADILIGTGTGFIGMILFTLVMIVMRRLRFIHHSITTMSFAIFGILIVLPLCVYLNVLVVPTQTRQLLLLLASGFTSFLGQTFLTLGLKYENAGPVALIMNFNVVFAFIWSFIFLNVAPDVYSLGGGCIVIFCIILSTVRKWLGNLDEDDEIRQTFGIILK